MAHPLEILNPFVKESLKRKYKGYEIREREDDYTTFVYFGIFKDNVLIAEKIVKRFDPSLSKTCNKPKDILKWVDSVIKNQDLFSHVKF